MDRLEFPIREVADAADDSIVQRGSGTRATAQRHADTGDALYRAQASLRTLVELSPELVVVHREGTIVYANAAVGQALGLRTDDIVGMPIAQLFHADDRAAVETRVMAPPAHSSDQKFAVRWRKRLGGYRSTEAVVATIDFEGSNAALVLARDVTERVDPQQQLLQRERMAALGTLAAGVAHEINNPLTYLVVNTEHVLRRLRVAIASDDPGAELAGGTRDDALTALVQSLQHAVEGANRVRQTVRDLLTFSQGNIEQRRAVDVRGIVESAVQMAWHEIRHRARLVKSLAEVPSVNANEARLGQVFLNLLLNAAQAIPEGHSDVHEIRVSTMTDEHGSAVVEVSDTGLGIAPEDMPYIFDPFFTTKGESGTGLGLAISHGTIKGLGGDILVKSAPGGGKTTFRVVLPTTKIWRQGSLPAKSNEPQDAERLRMLVIDDDRLVTDALARSLSRDGEVEAVNDAQEALARIAAGKRYDVILCDLMMPVMTGMDFYAEVVRVQPKLARHILFMTGGAFTTRARAFVDSVVNTCFEKPLDMSKLRSFLVRTGRE